MMAQAASISRKPRTSPQVFEVYGIDSTPWFLVLGADGRVMSRGIVNTLEQMEVAIELVLSTSAESVLPMASTSARMEA